MVTKRRIAILVPASFGYNEGVLRGIVRYAAAHPAWVTLWQDPEPAVLGQVAAWRPDGIVGYLYNKPQAETVLALGRPVVNISGNLHVPGVPRVSVQDEQVATLAVDYFWARGFRHFACLTTRRRWFHKLRDDAFAAAVEQRGGTCERFTGWYDARGHLRPDRHDPYPELREWLRSLPRPVALFGVQDAIAVAAVEAAHECGLRVPDDIAVLGADNSATLCMLANPSLSSIELALEAIGLRAGEMLDRLLDGHRLPDETVLLPPVRVIERQSTNVVGVADDDVSAALRFIFAHAHRPIGVSDVLGQVPISRRALEQRFRQHLACTPLQAIHRAHVARAVALLAETDLSMPQVAAQSGLGDAAALSRLFHKTMGLTPTAYRRRVRYCRA